MICKDQILKCSEVGCHAEIDTARDDYFTCLGTGEIICCYCFEEHTDPEQSHCAGCLASVRGAA